MAKNANTKKLLAAPAKPAKAKAPKSTKAAPMQSIGMPNAAQEKKWRARDAMETLTRAEEIRRDKPLMADVKREAARRQSELAAITGKKS